MVEGRRLVILRTIFRSFSVLAVLALTAGLMPALAQSAPTGIHGDVTDPSGAVIPGATVTVTTSSGKVAATVTSSDTGTYSVTPLKPGDYTVDITEQGFAPFHADNVAVREDHVSKLDATLAIAVQKQQVEVHSEEQHVSTSPGNNASSLDLKGNALNALSDNPDDLQNELEALAGPGAGPNGAQIYIDGFSGGQLPPKSDIREIRINNNPFSAQFSRLGYGRIEIFTKAGTGHWHGSYHVRGNDSSFDAPNPLLNANLRPGQTATAQEPSYYGYDMFGNLSGPIAKHASFNFDLFYHNSHDQSIINATDPNNLNSTLHEAFPQPSSRIYVSPRVDFQVGQNNTFTVRYAFFRASNTNNGVGETVLPSQATDSTFSDNTLQASDSIIMNKNLVDDIRFQYHRRHSEQTSQSSLPSVSLSNQFVTGGNSSQTSRNSSNDTEFQDYFTASAGSHALSFGMRMRTYNENDYSDSGSNGAYTFTSQQAYEAGTPSRYSYTKINNPTASSTLYDLAFYYQDNWTVNPRFTFSYGVRWEGQNHISDHSDWAPRVSFAYALNGNSKKAATTVLRAGYGWFYHRFGISNVIQTIQHNMTGTPNQQEFTITNPPFYNPNQTTQIDSSSSFPGASTSAPTYYNIDPRFSSPNDMQGAVGIDQQITKHITSNVTYLYTRGIHQFITNNIGAIANENVDPQTNTYTGTVTPPTQNIYQFQSDGIYKENQIIATVHAFYKELTLFSYYSYSNAKSDTSGMPTVPSKPTLDYGRANFDVHNRVFVLATLQLPYRVTLAPMLFAQSGNPFNITTGSDLTGNNAYNSRPTFAKSCSEPNTIKTPYGCLNADPIGTNEPIIPHNLGTGPANYGMNLRISKVIGFGPKVKGGGGGGFHHHHGHGLGARGLSGNSGPIGRFNARVPRKYTLTLAAFASNVFNHPNLAPPNGTINLTQPTANNPNACANSSFLTKDSAGNTECAQPFFLKSQNLAGGFFHRANSSNRSIFLQAEVSF